MDCKKRKKKRLLFTIYVPLSARNPCVTWRYKGST